MECYTSESQDVTCLKPGTELEGLRHTNPGQFNISLYLLVKLGTHSAATYVKKFDGDTSTPLGT